MPAKSKIAIDVTLGELKLLLRLAELQDTDVAGTPVYKLQREMGLSREAAQNALKRVEAGMGEFVLEHDVTGRIRATAAGKNAGHISELADSIIRVAKSPATDQWKLEQHILAVTSEMVRRHTEGDFDIGDGGEEPMALIERTVDKEAVANSSAAGNYVGGGEGPMATEYRCDPNVTLGELLMLQDLAALAYDDEITDPRSELVRRREVDRDLVSSSMLRVQMALGIVEEVVGQVAKPTPAARNIGEAAQLLDFLIMLSRRTDLDQDKVRLLIVDLTAKAKRRVESGQLDL